MSRRERPIRSGERKYLVLIGLGHLLDGLIITATLGQWTGGYAYAAARQLAQWRFNQLSKEYTP
jgi:hypothetical protein